MLKLRTLGTGSSGNCYILNSNGKKLILDAGVPIAEIKQGIDFDLQSVSGCIISHGHLDHLKSADKLEKIGIPVWKAHEDEVNLSSFEGFTVQAFKIPHNGVENRGFYIRTDNQRILYLTDFEYIPYVFKKQKIQHMLIECNYSEDRIDRDLPQYVHKVLGHSELQTVKEFIRTNKTPDMANIILCHMGTGTLNKPKALKEIQKVAGLGVNVCFAKKGVEMELSMAPF